MDWITPWLAIGNYLDARDPGDAVDAILCLDSRCRHATDAAIEIFTCPLADGPGNSAHSVQRAIDYICEVVAGQGRLLVHCHAGRSRSVCVVARYFMCTEGLTKEQALSRIRTVRATYLSPGIEEILDFDIG